MDEVPRKGPLPTEPLTETEAYLQAAVLGAYVDGLLRERERCVLLACVRETLPPTDEREQMLRLVQLLPRQMPAMKKGWRDERLAQINASLTSHESRRRAFALAARVAHADGVLGLRESRLLISMMDVFELDANFARRIMKENQSRQTLGPRDPRTANSSVHQET